MVQSPTLEDEVSCYGVNIGLNQNSNSTKLSRGLQTSSKKKVGCGSAQKGLLLNLHIRQ